jgi:hypothetical protein
MAFADLLPARLARRDRPAKHRAADEVARLRHMLAGAEILIKGLRLQLNEQDTVHEEVVQRIDDRYTETIRGLEQQIADLERRLDIRTFAEAAAARTQELDVRGLRERFETGPVRRLGASPLADTTQPQHVPAWARTD